MHRDLYSDDDEDNNHFWSVHKPKRRILTGHVTTRLRLAS